MKLPLGLAPSMRGYQFGAAQLLKALFLVAVLIPAATLELEHAAHLRAPAKQNRSAYVQLGASAPVPAPALAPSPQATLFAHIIQPPGVTAPSGMVAAAAVPDTSAIHYINGEFENPEDAEIYRPWKLRYKPQGYHIKSESFDEPEFRPGYRRFMVANPGHALVPNSEDRNAQSKVVFVFGLTIISTVVCLMIAADVFQVISGDDVEFAAYQFRMFLVLACTAIPWIGLFWWLLHVFVKFFFNPCRDIGRHRHSTWQCSVMLWYLISTPLINGAYFFVQTLWATTVFFGAEKQAQMGRMFNPVAVMGIPAASRGGSYLRDLAGRVIRPSVRHTLLAFEVINAIIGGGFVFYRWGANAQYCQPEVYWTAAALFASNCIIVIFTALAFFSSIFVGILSTNPWVEDFSDSFWTARSLRKKMAKQSAEPMEPIEEKAAPPGYEAHIDYEWEQERAEDAEEAYKQEVMYNALATHDALHEEAKKSWEEAKEAHEKPVAHALAEEAIINSTRRVATRSAPARGYDYAPGFGAGGQLPPTSASAGPALYTAPAPVPSNPLLDASMLPPARDSDVRSESWRSAVSGNSQAFQNVLKRDSRVGSNFGSAFGNPERSMFGGQRAVPMAVTDPPPESPPMASISPRNLPWKSEGFVAGPFGQAPSTAPRPVKGTGKGSRSFLDARPL